MTRAGARSAGASRIAGLLSLLALASCGGPSPQSDAGTLDAGAPDAGMRDASARDAGRVDPAEVESCLACHADRRAAWARPHSHALLLYCTTCHETEEGTSGPGHASIRPCSDCHSEAPHPDANACSACHDPHGTAQIYLVRDVIDLADGTRASIHFTAPEGASPDGLARAGVAGESAGTGLCEVCHGATSYYDAAATGVPHHLSFCPLCHSHQDGFAPPP